jgi:uncharacterized membrane protein YgdD (TMEM256/DUF423 family)
MNRWVVCGAVSGFLAVAFGAFGAHGLAGMIDEHSIDVFKTGAQYQMYHALALLALGGMHSDGSDPRSVPGWAFVIGTVLFSGSLYLLALTDAKWLGAITPLGGLSFMVGWAGLAYLAILDVRGSTRAIRRAPRGIKR